MKHYQDMKWLHGKQRKYLDIVLIFYNYSIMSSSLCFQFTKTLNRHCFSINLISPDEQCFSLENVLYQVVIMCSARDTTVVVKKLPAVLATYVNSRNSYKTLAKRLLQLYSICSVAKIQHKEITVVTIFEIVFLEIPNVTIKQVF